MHIDSVIALPHAAKGIAQRSSKTTLFQCTLVNKAFHNAFVPYVWLHVNRKRSESPIDRHVLAKYGRHVRSASLMLGTDILSFVEDCPNLKSLASPCGDLDWATLAAAMSSLQPKVERLDLFYNSAYSGFLSFLAIFKGLRSLELEYNERGFPDVLIASIMNVCQTQAIRLERFEVKGSATLDLPGVINSNADDAHLLLARFEFPATLRSFLFKYLEYDPAFSRHAMSMVLAVVEHCPNLEEVSISEVDVPELRQISDWLRARKARQPPPPPYPHTLTALHFAPYTHWSDPVLADRVLADLVLLLHPNTLRQLTFRSGHVGTRLLEAVLTQHPQSIEVLDVGCENTVTQMTSALAQAFLSRCPSLRVFVVGQGVSSAILSGHDAINHGKPWACQHLEVLELSIGGFCRESNNDDEEGPDGQGIVPCQTHDQCLAQERQVMEQLGRLRSLSTLDVSIYPRRDPSVAGVPGGMVDTTAAPPHLLWTLEAGLDRLASLKKLTKFLCYGVEHKAQVDEVQWMKQHWPELMELSCGWDEGLYASEISLCLQENWGHMFEYMNLLQWLG